MDLVLLELLLWVGLLFFFWALKEGLGQVEADIDALSLANNGRRGMRERRDKGFSRPEQAAEHIGSYRDMPIFRYVLIEGKTYQFDRVCPPEQRDSVDQDECCVAPGLVYQECTPPPETFR